MVKVTVLPLSPGYPV